MTNGQHPRRSLRVRLALWYAGAGAAVLLAAFMIALSTRVWVPAGRVDVVWALLVGLPATACVLAVAGYVIAGRALAPLAIMTQRARRLSATSLNERLPVADAYDELGELAAVFNQTLDRLENSFSELRRFTGDASHELRTPLTAIRAVGEVALRQENSGALRDAIGSMLEEVGRMNQLIERLLLLAQADHDLVPVSLASIGLREVALDIADSLDVVAGEKSQTIDVEDVEDVKAVADEALLRLALMNLLHNAIRYSPQGGRIQLRTAKRGSEAILEVADAGPGIAPEHRARVFERFYRADKARSRADGGTGLGLAIVKWTAERMRGEVELESEVGRGSVFRLRLPLAGGIEQFARSSKLPAEQVVEPLPELFADAEESARADIAAVLARLRTDPRGLIWEEAERRLSHFGANEAETARPPSWPVLIWHAANNPFNGVLILLGIVSLLTRDPGAAAVMTVMVILSTGLRFWQERKSLVQAESLRKLVRNKVTVLRADNDTMPGREPSSLDHRASEILLERTVPGDIVLLSAGDMVPGDLRLLESRDLFVTQSALTGEAMPVEKVAGERQRAETSASGPSDRILLEQPDLLFMGSSVISGTGKGVVLATGRHTYFGATAGKLVSRRASTAFDRGVNEVSWLLIRFMLVMVPIVFFINGLSKGRWVEAFFFAVAVAVGLTPEMLPMIVNANLARGALAMSRHKAIVKRLSAIQNLGAMDILCTDKTGTLTQDHVALIHHVDLHGRSSRRVLEHAYLNSYFQTGLKNLLDRAVVERSGEPGLRELARSFSKLDEIPFDFGRRRMSVALQHTPAKGATLLICKGAVEEMLKVCSQAEDAGNVVPLTAELREKLKRLRDELNEDGLRVVAVAFKAISAGPKPFGIEDETDLIFSGFVAFLDPPKESARDALRLLCEHGVTVKILTGDNATVARKICREVGLEAQRVATGDEIEHLSDEALARLAESTTVFARVSPPQKSRIVNVLKARNHTVGFMGDGINDATALREADVGITVDSGVDIAKEAADVILLEKSLLVLERGVVEGRRTFGNIVKYIKMAASSNFGNVLSVLIASAALPFLPMLAIQLLVQNLLYDVSQTAIPWDRMDEEFVKRPRQWEPGSIASFMLCIGPVSSLFDIAAFLILWFVFGANTPAAQSLFQSGWFVEGLLTQTLIVHMIRTQKIPFTESTATPPLMLLTLLVAACGVWLPFSLLAPALKLQALPGAYFWWLAGIVTAYCLTTQLVKGLYIRRFGGWL